jgi:hypothetical protein
MDPCAPLTLRRVLVGVVVGLVLVSLAFYGWVQYRRSQYTQHERAVLGRYHEAYTLCVAAGNPAFACANRVQNACVRDPFWTTGKPFAFDPESATPDSGARCRDGLTSG